MTTAAEKIEAARERRRMSKAELSRRAHVPASWIRSFATGKIGKGDPERLRRLAEVLELNYRELLALTDQLGAVEELERRPVASGDDRIDRLLQVVEVQQGTIGALTGAIDRQRADIEALADLVRRLLPTGGAQVTPPDPEAPLPNEQAVIERTRDVTGLPLTESRAEAPSGRRAARAPRAAPRGCVRP